MAETSLKPAHGDSTLLMWSCCVTHCLTLLQPLRQWPARLLCPWDFPGKNSGVGGRDPSPGDLPDPATEPVSPVSSAVQKVDRGSPSSPLHVANSH